MTNHEDPATVDGALRLEAGIHPEEREALVAGWPRMAATSHHVQFDKAINEVRDDMIRLISDAKNKNEPRNNKHLRETTRHD